MARLTRAVALAAALAALAAVACSGPGGPAPTPSPKAELILGLSPSRAADSRVAAARQLAGLLSGLLKVPVIARVEPTAAALGNDLADGRIDLAWSDSLTYVALRAHHPLAPVLRAARCFPTYTASPPPANCTPQPGRPAIIICGANVSVPELADGGDWSLLRGKRFAFQDPTSLPGYVWPRYFLSRNLVDPDRQLTKSAPTPSDLAVALSVYNGLADCGATAGDGRGAATGLAPDIFDRTKVVFVAPGNVPGDTVFIGSRLNAGQARQLRAALIKLGTLPAASGPIQQLAEGAIAMLPAVDRDFDLLRAAVAAENPKLIEQALPTPTPSASRSPGASRRSP